MQLKHSFQLDKSDDDYRKLCKIHAAMAIHQSAINRAQRNLTTLQEERTQVIGDLLLDKDYIIHSHDVIRFFEQTGEVHVLSLNNDGQYNVNEN